MKTSRGFIQIPILAIVFFGAMVIYGLAFSVSSAQYYGSGCEQYGVMAYESGGYCKCMSGYVFDTNYLGNKTCKSASSVCTERYGVFSRYDSLSSSCECTYGYGLYNQYGRTQCVSYDNICEDKFGYNAEYDSLSDSCGCRSGYELSRDSVGGYECKSCFSKYGLNSSYNYITEECECDDGYTLKDGQCVEKQNNVYFKLLDVNTDDKQAIIKSEYDSRKYLITYGVGCLSTTINRYKNKDLVVNLGTDFEVDSWDTIVLQNDSQTCSITRRERTFEDTLEIEVEEDYAYYYVPETPVVNVPTTQVIQPTPAPVITPEFNTDEEVVDEVTVVSTLVGKEIEGGRELDDVNISEATTSNSDSEKEEGGFLRKLWKTILSWFGK